MLENQKGRIVKNLLLALPIAVLAGCAVGPDEPIVAAFNGDSVEIQSYGIDATDPEVVAEATRICGRANKRAELASTRQLPASGPYDLFPASSHLFLCL